MKIHKILSAAALLLASVSFAQAQTTYVYVTGSTANRAPADAAILATFDNGSPNTGVAIASDSGLGGENNAIFSGTIGGSPYIIKAAWTGSENGLQAVTQSLNESFLDDSWVTSVTPGTAVTSGVPNVTTATTVTSGVNVLQVPTFEFSDTYATASQFYNPAVTLTEVTYSGKPVAVNVFKFFASKGAPSNLTSVTSQNVKILYQNGKIPLSQFTGAVSDETNAVFAVGRNPDSGTRLTALLESGFGTAFSGVVQYAPSTDGTTPIQAQNTAGGLKLIKYPAGTVNGVTEAVGNNGYASGGNLAKSLTSTFTTVTTTGLANGGTHTYNNGGATATLVGYASAQDGDGQEANGLVELAYNGVSLGKLSDYNTSIPLTEGQYTYWSYEHAYVNGTTIPTVVQSIINNLPGAAAFGGKLKAVAYASMKVSRAVDGGVVSSNTAVTAF